ncbi:hypothetical protein F4677DRAFT_283152 [Hypoxylon crocopeplum]|nr:hypothetical protein F4677DRAFT_283152 [Hypoxylon crocopeplum]
MPRPLRSSCDRCHSQKLKCPKQPGLASCTRCVKAGTNCVFSPAGLSTRRATPTPVYLDGDLNMQFDWPSLDLEDALATPPEAPQGLQPEVQQVGQVGQAEATLQDPRSTYIHQLTAFAVEIDQVSSDLSPIPFVHVPKDRPVGDYHAKFIENFTNHRCVEQLFTLAQRLTDIYPQVLKILFDKPKYSECHDLNCFHTVELPDELEKFLSTTDEDRNEVDSFLFNLLVLCHGKVLDVIGSLILCARTCTQITLASPDFLEPDVHIPEVRVGNFVATNTAASTMQTVLMVHIASVLLDHARQLKEQVTAVTRFESNSKQSQMLRLQCELLEEKAVSKTRLLEQVKIVLTKVGLMK